MRTPIKSAIFGIAVLAASASAFAHPDTSEPGNHWLDHLVPAQPTPQQLAPFGFVDAGPATREIDLTGDVKHINVVAGETVRLVSRGGATNWRFDTLGTPTFMLPKAIPGMPAVEVHVSANPLYTGG